MAIAGGATVAYMCQMIDGELVVTRGTALRSGCLSVGEAVKWLRAGQRATVAGPEMAALRAALGRVTLGRVVDDGPASLNEVVNEHYPEDWGL